MGLSFGICINKIKRMKMYEERIEESNGRVDELGTKNT